MRILMSPPEHFDVTNEINTGIDVQSKPDPLKALDQWHELYKIITDRLGTEVELIKPQLAWPDMVFTANAGLVLEDKVVPARFRFAERQGVVPYFNKWFTEQGYKLHWLPDDVRGSFEGEGDILKCGDVFLAGYRMRSDTLIYPSLSTIIGKQILPLELVDKRLYHLDTCLLPLRRDLIAYYPAAFDEYACKVIENFPGEKIHVSEHDALRLACNAIVVGNCVALNSGCDEFENELRQCGFETHPTDLSEFVLAGGAAKSMTLFLDH